MEGRKRKRVQHNRVDSNQSAKYSAGTQLPHCSLAALNELSLANNDLSPSDNIPLCTTGGFKSLAMVTAAECMDIVLLTNNGFSSYFELVFDLDYHTPFICRFKLCVILGAASVLWLF